MTGQAVAINPSRDNLQSRQNPCVCRATTIKILYPLAIRDNNRNHPAVALAAKLILLVARHIILTIAPQTAITPDHFRFAGS